MIHLQEWLSHMIDLEAFEQLLKRRIGLNIDSIGRGRLEADVKHRMESVDMTDGMEYLELLRSSEEEFDALVEEVRIPETWFFRNGGAFEYLKRFAKEEYRRGITRRIFRVLSAPCSTGEEAYSIAFTLLDAGFAPSDFAVDAVDISGNALERAREGIYRDYSFRGTEKSFREKFFEKVDSRYRICSDIKNNVTFRKLNLLDDGTVVSKTVYDAIFCRNLLIYLTPEQQKKLVERLEERLSPDGVLFLGHSESLVVSETAFRSVEFPGSFAFRRDEGKIGRVERDGGKRFATNQTRIGKWRMPDWVREGEDAAKKKERFGYSISSPAKEEKSDIWETEDEIELSTDFRTKLDDDTVSETNLLAEAKLAANKGDLAKALICCEQYVEAHRTDPGGYCLMGLLKMSNDDLTGAEQCLKKCVYLSPDHEEALNYLVMLHERRGQHELARRLRRRFERVMAGKGA